MDHQLDTANDMKASLAFSINDPQFRDFLPEDDVAVMDSRWTDFNIKDPGVTMLEALNYALIDLNYRYHFPIADLLQGKTQNGLSEWSLKKLMTRYAVSENDYRRVIGYLPEIINTVVIPAQKTNTPANPRKLSCLLDVFIASDKPQITQNGVAGLLKNRALGEYYNRQPDHEAPMSSRVADIDVQMNITWMADQENNTNKKKVLETIQAYLLPKLTCVDFRNLFKQDLDLTEVLTGPLTVDPQTKEWLVLHPDSLDRKCYRCYLFPAGILEILMALPFIANVTEIQFKLAEGAEYQDVLDLGAHYFTRLRGLHINNDDRLEGKPIVSEPYPSFPMQYPSQISGQYRNVGGFNSIQLSFPPNYSLGNFIPEDKREQAGSANFRTYLSIFDQVLGNVSSQMGNLQHVIASKSCKPVVVNKDLRNDPFYRDLNIPAPKAASEALRKELTDQRLNYLLALNGYQNLDYQSHLPKGQDLEIIKRKLLELVNLDGLELDFAPHLNAIFQANSLGLFQSQLQILLRTDIEAVRVLEHCFLQPVATDDIGLDFEISVFLFPKESSDKSQELSDNLRQYINTLVRSLCPAHIVPSYKLETSGLTEFDDLLNQAYPPAIPFYFDQPISASQKEAMTTLLQKVLAGYSG